MNVVPRVASRAALAAVFALSAACSAPAAPAPTAGPGPTTAARPATAPTAGAPGTSPTSATTAASGPAKEITVTMLPGVLQNLYDPYLDQFTRDTNIKVNWALLPFDDLSSKVLTSVKASAGAYDVALVSEQWMLDFGPYLQDLSPNVQKAPANWDVNDLNPSSLKGGQYNGTQVGVPWRDAARILYWNKKAFDEAGLSGPPKTWNELLHDAEALTKRDASGQVQQWGYAVQGVSGQQAAIEFFTMLYSWGGTLLSPDGKQAAFNSQAGVDALQFYSDLLNKQHVAPPDSANWGWDQMITALQQGKVAMTVAYAPYAALVDDPQKSQVAGQFQFAVAPTQTTTASLGGAWTFAIPKDARDKEAAWTFIQYFTTKQMQLQQTKIGNSPVRQSVFDDPQLNTDRRDFPAAKQALASAVRPPQVRQLAQIQDILGRAVNSALLGQANPKDALDGAASEVNALLAR
jgi:multiple sugar transport system substrate-binding protein